MESLLKLSGLLGEEDVSTDLGVLEKRLEDQRVQAREQDRNARKQSDGGDTATTPTKSPETSDPAGENAATETSVDSPGSSERAVPKGAASTQAQKKEEVEALSDLMCSLVTTNFGETRYIGLSCK